MQIKHLDELYTWTQIRKLMHVSSFNPDQHFIPIAVYAPHEGKTIRYGGNDGYYEWYGRRKAYYAKQLWEITRLNLASQEEEALTFEIVEMSECFNTIRFKNPTLVKTYIIAFKETLETLAKEGHVNCAIGHLPTRFYPWNKTKRYEEIVIEDDAVYSPYFCHSNVSEIKPYTPCEKPSWDEIKHYFIDLAENELAFLHGESIINKQPSELDKALIEACVSFNVERVQHLLEQGANPNAIDFGDSVLVSMIDEFIFSQSKQIHTFAIILDLLLAYGCDINLCPYYSATPLYESIHANSVITKLLLQKGANPNSVSWISMSETPLTPLDHIQDDIAAYGKDPELMEICNLIDIAGGKFFSELVPNFWDN